jgi:hypothetical protein
VGDHDYAKDDAQKQQREGLKTIEIAQEIPPIQKDYRIGGRLQSGKLRISIEYPVPSTQYLVPST